MPPISDLEAIRRRQILEATMSVIAACGVSSATMAYICKAAGFSKGGLAHYYQSKQELIGAAFDEFFRRIFRKSQAAMAAFTDPIDQLNSFVWIVDANDTEAGNAFPLMIDFMALAMHDPDYRDILTKWARKWRGLLAGAVIRGQRQNRIRPIDPDIAVCSVAAIYQGIAMRMFTEPESASARWAFETVKQSIAAVLQIDPAGKKHGRDTDGSGLQKAQTQRLEPAHAGIKQPRETDEGKMRYPSAAVSAQARHRFQRFAHRKHGDSESLLKGVYSDADH